METSESISKEILKECYDLFLEGKSLSSISRQYGIVRQTLVNNFIKSYGYEPEKKVLKSDKITDSILSKSKELYLTGEYTVSEIARSFNVNRKSLSRELKKKYDINILSDGKKSVDSNYFDVIDSLEKAYWLGFLYADGHVTEERVDLGLALCDIKHVEKFKKAINSKHKICRRSILLDGQIFEAARISMKDKNLSRGLYKNGCVNNKSLIISFPDIDKELIPHFIRGYFDGDGIVSISRNKLICGFCSGSLEFLETLMFTLKRDSIIEKEPVISKDNRCNCYSFRIPRASMCNLFKYLYDNSTEDIRLDRKYELINTHLPS